MTAEALLRDLGQRGVAMEVTGGRLRWRGPKGVVTPKVVELLRLHKRAIIAALSAHHAVAPLCSDHPAANPWARLDGDTLCSGCHPEPPAAWWGAARPARASTDGGCSPHAVTPEDYRRRWAAAYNAEAPALAMCRCCGGPTSNDSTLLCRACEPLTERAARLAPKVRLTVHEREDGGDIALLRRIRAVIDEYEVVEGVQGGGLVHVVLKLKDGRRVVAQWRALACRELRLALGRLLARHATGGTDGPAD